MTPIRPKFRNPPLIERAISIVFDPLPNFSIGDFGRFWAEIADEFPSSEAMDPVGVEIEKFAGFQPSQMQFRLVTGAALPRAGFRNDNGEMIQIQPDRFGFNWIKTGDHHRYPHSEATLSRFFALFDLFTAYAESRGLGPIQIRQCELTNVNVVLVSDVGEAFSDIATVFKTPHLDSVCPNLRLESQVIGSKHLLVDDNGAPIGRLHALGQPSLKVPSNEEAYRFDIVARGAPIGDGPDGVRKFFDYAVSAVNAVFLASTTEAGRRFWGRYDA